MTLCVQVLHSCHFEEQRRSWKGCCLYCRWFRLTGSISRHSKQSKWNRGLHYCNALYLYARTTLKHEELGKYDSIEGDWLMKLEIMTRIWNYSGRRQMVKQLVLSHMTMCNCCTRIMWDCSLQLYLVDFIRLMWKSIMRNTAVCWPIVRRKAIIWTSDVDKVSSPISNDEINWVWLKLSVSGIVISERKATLILKEKDMWDYGCSEEAMLTLRDTVLGIVKGQSK